MSLPLRLSQQDEKVFLLVAASLWCVIVTDYKLIPQQITQKMREYAIRYHKDCRRITYASGNHRWIWSRLLYNKFHMDILKHYSILVFFNNKYSLGTELLLSWEKKNIFSQYTRYAIYFTKRYDKVVAWHKRSWQLVLHAQNTDLSAIIFKYFDWIYYAMDEYLFQFKDE